MKLFLGRWKWIFIWDPRFFRSSRSFRRGLLRLALMRVQSAIRLSTYKLDRIKPHQMNHLEFFQLMRFSPGAPKSICRFSNRTKSSLNTRLINLSVCRRKLSVDRSLRAGWRKTIREVFYRCWNLKKNLKRNLKRLIEETNIEEPSRETTREQWSHKVMKMNHSNESIYSLKRIQAIAFLTRLADSHPTAVEHPFWYIHPVYLHQVTRRPLHRV